MKQAIPDIGAALEQYAAANGQGNINDILQIFAEAQALGVPPEQLMMQKVQELSGGNPNPAIGDVQQDRGMSAAMQYQDAMNRNQMTQGVSAGMTAGTPQVGEPNVLGLPDEAVTSGLDTVFGADNTYNTLYNQSQNTVDRGNPANPVNRNARNAQYMAAREDAANRDAALAAEAEAAGVSPEALLAPSNAPNPMYKVSKGDTLSQIAKQHGTDVQTLKEMNGLANADRIKAGQVLTLPNAFNGDASGVFSPTMGMEAPKGNNYRIQKGDTLSGLAKQFGTTVQALQELNGISDANKIRAGQQLKY